MLEAVVIRPLRPLSSNLLLFNGFALQPRILRFARKLWPDSEHRPHFGETERQPFQV